MCDTLLDVVFVHGLGGDPIETWRSGTDENTSWPHWLALEFGSQIGVWTLGYAAAPTKLRGLRAALFGSEDPDAGAAMSLPRRAENALDRLVGAGIGQRPVCFITHSLGGLLVKSILRRAADSASAPERLQVVEQCCGVLFLATPHHGSRLADLASAFRLYFPTVNTLDLKDNDDHLMDLYEWYRGYAPSHQILTRSYYENKETKGVVVVVPRSSADPGVTGETARGPTPLDRDHLEISKPRNRTDQAYLGSTQLIRLILKGAIPETAPAQPSAIGASDAVSNKNVTEATISEKPHLVPLLDLVIGENRTLEQALDAVRFINGQMNPSKKARLVYIEEGSTHLFIDGPEETLREIQELYRHGELQKLLADRETPGMLTILSAELIYDKKVLEKAALINEVMDMRVNKNELIVANLSGADLTGADLTGVDLRKADLNVADLSGANLSGADLSWADLSRANLSRANLSGADLFEANLSGADLSWADLSRANLSGADLFEANLSRAILIQANLSRADLTGADLTGVDLRKADLIGADLNVADLSGADFSWANLSRANLSGAYLSRAILIQANLSGAYLSRAILIQANLSRANLSGAYLSRAILIQANLSRADLTGADLTGADLTGVDLRKADLNVADLSGANLSGANLSKANLSKANLSKANLSDADLNVADLSEAVFSGANLTKADFTKAMLVSSKFERNVGLTESQIIDMQSRGALFVDSPESGVPSLLR
jgi:uncharacterized protein YjbI with pentapeptide repeats